jgi:hypothetical protein
MTSSRFDLIPICVSETVNVAGLRCVSDNKSSLSSMLLLEYYSNSISNSNPTNTQ